jgi:predicted phosphodiesterase
MRIGVISDTHGYLDPRAAVALQGVTRILHAGDIGTPLPQPMLLCYWNHVNSLNAFSKSADSMLGRLI